MRLYKPTYTDRDGKKCTSRKWYVDFFDHLSVRRRLPAFENRKHSETFGRNIENLVSCVMSGDIIRGDLESWLNSLPDSLLKKFVQWGLLSGQRAETMKPLEQHLEDYIAVLKARKHSHDYRVRIETRIKIILTDCRFTHFRDVVLSAIELYLGTLKTKGYSETTCGHYLDAFKTFLNWAKQDGRILKNPIDQLSKSGRDSKQKGVLTPEQFMLLIHNTIENGRVIQTTAGIDRGILYFLAGMTGLRRKELLLLTWADMHLDEDCPYILARADTTKNAREARQPIPTSMTTFLTAIMGRRTPHNGQRVFGGFAMSINTAMLIREDLTAAKIPLEDKDGNEICFHSLRNSYITFLANSQAPAKVIQKLARHSDPKLTFNTYARVLNSEEQKAVSFLPNIGQFVFAACFANSAHIQRTSADFNGQEMTKTGQKTAFLAQKHYPQGESNPCYRDENPAS